MDGGDLIVRHRDQRAGIEHGKVEGVVHLVPRQLTRQPRAAFLGPHHNDIAGLALLARVGEDLLAVDDQRIGDVA